MPILDGLAATRVAADSLTERERQIAVLVATGLTG
jgi:DNA-binding CsgD family transcriptional regulator